MCVWCELRKTPEKLIVMLYLTELFFFFSSFTVLNNIYEKQEESLLESFGSIFFSSSLATLNFFFIDKYKVQISVNVSLPAQTSCF